jgi:hypothetical protein
MSPHSSVCVCLAGFACAVQETVGHSGMFDLVDVELARWYRDNTPKDAVVLTTTSMYPNHFRVVRARPTCDTASPFLCLK